MLGWEYPPHIAGGLGVACAGLTKALAQHVNEITFVIPQLLGGESAPHMQLIDPWSTSANTSETTSPLQREIKKIAVPAMLKPYWGEKDFEHYLEEIQTRRGALQAAGISLSGDIQQSSGARYGKDIFEEIQRYAGNVILRLSEQEFDLIHAHDWMTFPAAVALSKLTGKPLILHVHSLEYDRCGTNGNQRIIEVERLGFRHADKIIAVSQYTKSLIHREHAVSPERIEVVHNGIYPKSLKRLYKKKNKLPSKVVLFLGRVTFQKGPDYFIHAAAKIVPKMPDALFVIAGSGDMLSQMIETAENLGIGKNCHFTGFLGEQEVEEIFSLADLYVMPSVSEPFGLSALEAIDFDTPAIISRQSGVSEVLNHSLKFDFWDVDRLANLIVNGLVHKELREDMISNAKQELGRVRWELAASRTTQIYHSLIH